ncbi:MAG: hypothetical protein ACRYG8_29485 [Janthinobacterium lividum]
MNVKVLFGVIFALSVLPFVIAAFVSDQTKRSVGAFACCVVAILALWTFGQTALGAPLWAWLHNLHHVLFALAAGWFGAALAAVGSLLHRRRRLGQLQWTHQPSQQQFSRSCLTYLRRSGWIPHGRLSRTFIDMERMDRGSKRATFVFSAHPFPMEAVRRLLSQTVWRLHGRVTVISWRDEAPGMRTIIENMGWRCVTVDQLREEEERDERL